MHFFPERALEQRLFVQKGIRVARLACPSLPPNHLRPGSLTPTFGDHGPSLDSALAARQRPGLRRPAADQHAARAALLGTWCRARAPRRHAPSIVGDSYQQIALLFSSMAQHTLTPLSGLLSRLVSPLSSWDGISTAGFVWCMMSDPEIYPRSLKDF